MVSFADLSHHQEDVTAATDVDLAAYAHAGHDRIAVKATQGLSFVDPRFTGWWRAAARLGLARVAYHFAQAAQSGAAEFDYFLAAVTAAGGLGPRDALCLDIEDDGSATARARADAYCKEFTARAVARGHPTGLVYTGRWYAEPNNIRADDVAAGWRRLWISDYGSRPDAQIRLPTGWTRGQVAARQFGSSIRVAGVRNPCDYSRVLIDWLTDTPPPSEDDMPSADELRTIIRDEVGKAIYLVLYGDNRDETKDKQTHADNLQRLRRDLEDPSKSPLLKAEAAQAAGIAGLKASVDELSRRIAAAQGGPVPPRVAVTGELHLASTPDQA